MKYSVIDVETTGFGNVDRVTEIAVVNVEDWKITTEWSALVDPQRLIPEKIIQDTGITNEMVQGRPLFEQVIPEFAEQIKGAEAMVAHYAQFDSRMIKNEFERAGMSISGPWWCTIQLAKTKHGSLPSYSLASLCAFYGINNDNAHRALSDARATAELFIKLNG